MEEALGRKVKKLGAHLRASVGGAAYSRTFHQRTERMSKGLVDRAASRHHGFWLSELSQESNGQVRGSMNLKGFFPNLWTGALSQSTSCYLRLTFKDFSRFKHNFPDRKLTRAPAK